MITDSHYVSTFPNIFIALNKTKIEQIHRLLLELLLNRVVVDKRVYLLNVHRPLLYILVDSEVCFGEGYC